MHTKSSMLARCTVLVLLLLVLFLLVWIPLNSILNAQLADVTLSLETSQGRERKQQYEYDEVVAELPLVRQELAETTPVAEAAEELKSELKARRKELRKQKEDLEAELAAQNEKEGTQP